MDAKQKKILSITLASWGVIMIGSGLAMNASIHPIVETTYSLGVNHVKVNESKTNEIVLKDITIEVNNPLSLNVKDYLQNVDQIDADTLKSLKLDTSMVKVSEAGSYTYTITFKKKKYNGTVVVKEKAVTNVELKLKEITIELGDALPVPGATNGYDWSFYIENASELTDEMKVSMKLDITNVNVSVENTYDYEITYNGTIYTGKVIVYVPRPAYQAGTTQNKEESKQEEKITCQYANGGYYDKDGNNVSEDEYKTSCGIEEPKKPTSGSPINP